jgi:uncharacterized protein
MRAVRFLLLVILVVVAIWAIRRALRAVNREETAARPAAPGDLVSCARCGLHLPRGEAREAQGGLYCSDEHARLGAGPKGG